MKGILIMGQKARLIKGVNDLQTMRPDIAQYWHPTKNDIKPDEIYYMSTKEIWFLYPYDDPNTGKHYDFEWEQQLCNKVKYSSVCPYLTKPINPKYIYPGFNDLYTLHKELIDNEWDWGKNSVHPSELAEQSHYNAWWKCEDFGHEYQRPVVDRVARKFCPICAKTTKTSFPEKAILFYIQKAFPDVIPNCTGLLSNKRLELDAFIPSLNVAIEFDGYNSHIKRINEDNYKNVLCKEKGINIIRVREGKNKENFLPSTTGCYLEYFVIDRDWKNFSNIIKDILLKLNINHIDVNIARDTQAIVKLCSEMHIENSLGELHPELIQEWSDKNSVSPFQVSAQSNVKFWWKCPKDGYEWLKSPNQRISDKKGCPVCGRQVVVPGINDVATLEPRILPFWNDDNIRPIDVGPRTTKKINVKCPDCGREWCDSLAHILARKHICQVCFKGKVTKIISVKAHRKTPVKAINSKTGEEIIFNSAAEAARTLNIGDASVIHKILKGEKHRVSTKGYTFCKI